MNNKGFAITGVMYSILVLFIVLSALIIFNLQNKKVLLDKLKDDTINNIENNLVNYDDVNTKYGPTYVSPKIGETHKGIVYLDPTDLKKYCDEDNSVSTTETITGCMKWYIFDDSGDNYKMILDHNTTAGIKWNDDSNVAYESSNLKPVVDDLVNTSGWRVTPRLITAQEVNTITGKTVFDASSMSDWYYFDDPNKGQTQTAKSQGASAYAWLYNYTSGCARSGCAIEDNTTYGYWTSTPIGTANSGAYIWVVTSAGILVNDYIINSYRGIRPVISIPKNTVINEACPYQSGQEFTFDYTGDVQTFKTPCSGNYKLEVWGAQGGAAKYGVQFTGGPGGYSTGNMALSKGTIYINVGGKGQSSISETFSSDTGYNGGGYATYTDNSAYGGGGGATHIATTSGLLSSLSSDKSSILIVAGGGGGAASYNTGTDYSGNGGVGGGLTGGDGEPATSTCYAYGMGGTQNNSTSIKNCISQGTINTVERTYDVNAGFGTGSNWLSSKRGGTEYKGAGGGGGYYGGYGSFHAPAGGGSGYIGGVSNGQTIAGNATMPTHDGKSTMTGNAGNGYAKITYLGE